MKTIITIIGFSLLFSVASAQNDNDVKPPVDEVKKIEVEWESEVFNFEEIPAKKPVTATFKFTNKGDVPVSVIKVRSSCGCTVASYDKNPVLPGKTGKVSAIYDAKKFGGFNKLVTVHLSDNSQHRLFLKGTVGTKPKPAGQK